MEPPKQRRPRKKETRKRNRTYPTGADHPRWLGGPSTKPCGHCGAMFTVAHAMRAQRFCSRVCGWRGQRYYRGPGNTRWKPEARRRNRGGPHQKWRNAVVGRDNATCRRCGAREVEMHAHHIKSYLHHPELRFDVANGETLCFRCHWAEHTALTAKAVKSGDTREGNPEPS